MKQTLLKISIIIALVATALPTYAQTLVTYLGPDDNAYPDSYQATTTKKEQSGFNSFLFGSNYKNVGVMRSKLIRTDKRIDYLTERASSTQDSNIKANINAEITELILSEDDMNIFIDQNESKFSLFGWFIKYLI